MKTSLNAGFACALAVVAALAHDARPASADEDNGRIFKPLEAVKLEFGSKRALGYFLDTNGACQLTVVLSSASDRAEAEASSGTRVQVSIQPGSGARFDTAEGKTGEFFCGPAGARMNARVLGRVTTNGS